MIKNKLNWQAVSNRERNSAISDLKSIISSSDGFILSFNLYSDLAISLTIEIEEQYIIGFYKNLSDNFRIIEREPSNLDSSSSKEWWVLLNVSFGQGSGDFKVEVPNVPG